MVCSERVKVKELQPSNVLISATIDSYDSFIHNNQHASALPSRNMVGPGGRMSSLIPDVTLPLYHCLPELAVGTDCHSLEHIDSPNIVSVHLPQYTLE